MRLVDALKSSVKSAMRAYPGIADPVWALLFPLFRRDELYFGAEYEDRKDAFRQIHDENRWQSEESRSGRGSEIDYTKRLLPRLERLLGELRVKTFLDAPCGDFNWMRHLKLPAETSYVGGDIVSPLVQKLESEHGDLRHRFAIVDIVEGPLPTADLWLCRDVLFHFPNKDILTTLRLFAGSGIPHLLTTNYHFERNNRDIKAGGFRFINLRRPPFNLPRPLTSIVDFASPEPPRYLDLWSREQVPKDLK